MSHVGWRRNNHEVDISRRSSEACRFLSIIIDTAKCHGSLVITADTSSQTNYNHCYFFLLKSAVCISLREYVLMRSYHLYFISPYEWWVDIQIHWAVRQQFQCKGPLVRCSTLQPSEQLVQREMKRCLLLRLRWTAQWLGNNGSHGTVRCSTSFRYSHSFVKSGPSHRYYPPEVLQSAEGNQGTKGYINKFSRDIQ